MNAVGPRRSLIGRALLWLAIAALVIYSVFPLYWALLTSLRTDEAIAGSISLIPRDLTFEQYGKLFDVYAFGQQYENSAFVAAVTTVITLVLSTFVAYAVARRRFKGRRLLVIGMLFSYMFPPLLTLIPLYVLMVMAGLADTRMALVISHLSVTMPLGIWLLWGFFSTLPFELEEAAMIDGCSRLGAFLRVILPLAVPGLITVGIFTFLISWNDFTHALVMVNSDSVKTLPLGVASLQGAFASAWGLMMASAVMIVAPLLVAFIFLNRFFIQGLSGGAMKG
ncbi:MAG: carbohydrate ABC transporter permease [Burkholderiaceae bacterium]